MKNNNVIPAMTDPLGKYWEQPSADRILIDDDYAVMDKTTLRQLPEYSSTNPSGVYPGKMWRAETRGIWWLRWYGESDNPAMCSNNQREILLA